MPDRIHILGLDCEELRNQMAAAGLPAYRGDQIRQWVFARRVDGFGGMTNLSKADRARLAERFVIAAARIAGHQQSPDGVHKLLLAWKDDATSEAVMIPAQDGRRTACISSQAGCPVQCRFCASGADGLQRNLTAGEIVEQVWQLARLAGPSDDGPAAGAVGRPAASAVERLSNVVFMGIGEPLANYDAVVKAIRLVNAPDGPNIGTRKITVSTIGLPAQIKKLAREELQITLAISLHAPNQSMRAELIPWAKKFTLDQVLDAARYYFQQTGREITLEYVCLGGLNTAVELADELADLAHSLRCNVNLIYYNPVAGLGFDRPSQVEVNTFRAALARRGVNVHIRPSRGLAIDAACGQLRRRLSGAGEKEREVP